MDDERDAEDAIRALDQIEFGRQRRRLRVDWTKQDRGGRRPGNSRTSGNSKPTKTLFVINFDPMYTRTRDLEKHFDPYGKIISIRIRRNFAFVQYESQEDATKALDATNMSKLMDQVVSVEYAVRNDDGRRNQYSPEQRGRGRSPGRHRDLGGRSPSPPNRRQRDSPDYGHGPSRDRVRHGSPYGRDSPDYGRVNARPESRRRDSPDYDRGFSPDAKQEMRGSPYRRDKDSPRPRTKYELRVSASPDVDHRSPSPPTEYKPRVKTTTTRVRDMDCPEVGRLSPSTDVKFERRMSTTTTRSRDKDSPDFSHGHGFSPSPRYAPSSPMQEKDVSPPMVEVEPPTVKPELKSSPKSDKLKDRVDEKKYRSRSPSTRKSKSENGKKQRREVSDM